MSFLSELKNKKETLKQTETLVTKIDGQRFIECNGVEGTVALPSSYGYVVDTKPDNVPVLIVDYLYIGSQDCTASSVLDSYDIKRVLSLGINADVCKIDHKFVECLDLPETNIKPVLEECLPYIQESLEIEENILVHCNAGVSRTAMVAVGYLMKYKNFSFNIAYNLVKEKRPAIQPNAGFKKQLIDLEKLKQL